MRCFLIFLMVLGAPLFASAEGRVVKVLPQLLDAKGRSTLAPSLYERDAYQAFLRKHPDRRKALRLAVEWKARHVDWSKLTLRAEMRGLTGDKMHTVTLDEAVVKNGLFENWSEFKIEGDNFRAFGRLVAWRVTLWENGRQIGELESFLWSGV